MSAHLLARNDYGHRAVGHNQCDLQMLDVFCTFSADSTLHVQSSMYTKTGTAYFKGKKLQGKSNVKKCMHL